MTSTTNGTTAHRATRGGTGGRPSPEGAETPDIIDRLFAAYPDAARQVHREVLGEPLRHLDSDDCELLLATLEEWLKHGVAKAAARALAVHGNTVHNRLNRLAELTGLNVNVPTQLTILTIGMKARHALTRAQANLKATGGK